MTLGYPLAGERRSGHFGVATQGAVEYFQRKHGLKRTGVVDSITAQKLIAADQALQSEGFEPPAGFTGAIRGYGPQAGALALAVMLALLAVGPAARRRLRLRPSAAQLRASGALGLMAAGLVLAPTVTVAAVAGFCGFLLLVRAANVVHRAAGATVPEALPTFSVIVPLESGQGVDMQAIIAALESLEYPSERLDGSLLIAKGDLGTVERLAGLERPGWLRSAMVDIRADPRMGRIWTHGLDGVRGEMSLVVDPADPPRPKDLLVAARALAEPSAGVVALNGAVTRFADLRLALDDAGTTGPGRTRSLGFKTGQARRSLSDLAVMTSSPRAPSLAGRRQQAWICVPTYNESEVVETFLAAVLEQVSELPVEPRVLIIDDNSPDGTAVRVAAIAARDPRVELLSRPHKQGIGPAYLAGFQHALDRGADRIVQMDCDFSHDPTAIRSLLRASQSAHVVVGSRYFGDGSVDAERSRARRSLSRWGNVYARRVLSAPVRDLTSGFKCFRREALELLDLDAVTTKGYGFQIETTYRALSAGLRVVEVPIEFHERLAGQSKMSSAIAFEAAISTVRLRRGVASRGRGTLVPLADVRSGDPYAAVLAG